MPVLQLPACPICGAADSLVRQVLDRTDHPRTAYGCWECSSVLVWLGDDLWLQSDRWAYQHVGRPDKRHLLHRPLTAADLQRLAESVPGIHPRVDAAQAANEIDGFPGQPEEEPVEAEPVDEGPVEEEVIRQEAAPSPPPRREEPPAQEPAPEPRRDAAPAGERRYNVFDLRGGGAALVPMAQILPEGMKLALVRYDGLRAEPVAIFHEGELRAIPATPPRSRGSPLLWIGVALTLLCFACAASTVVLSGFVEGGLPVALPNPVAALQPATSPPLLPAVLPSQAPLPTNPPLPTDTPVPTDTPLPSATPVPAATETPLAELKGVTAYMPAPGSLTIVGEVLNASQHGLRFVEILGTFFDGEGAVVGTDSAYAELKTLEVGGRAPFRLTAEGLPDTLANYDLRVSYVTSDQDPLRVEVLSQQSFRDEAGGYHIAGEVRNPYGYALGPVEVVATYYSDANQVVRVEKTFAQVASLEPGQTSPFEITLSNPPPDLSHYRLQTEAGRP